MTSVELKKDQQPEAASLTTTGSPATTTVNSKRRGWLSQSLPSKRKRKRDKYTTHLLDPKHTTVFNIHWRNCNNIVEKNQAYSMPRNRTYTFRLRRRGAYPLNHDGVEKNQLPEAASVTISSSWIPTVNLEGLC